MKYSFSFTRVKSILTRPFLLIFSLFGYRLIRNITYDRLLQYERAGLDLLITMPNMNLQVFSNLKKYSKSQIGQDIFVLAYLDYAEKGFFVEIGAADGVTLSNTYLLENTFAWNGILAEPARIWHADLEEYREATIDKRCVWKDSNIDLLFSEYTSPEFSKVKEKRQNESELSHAVVSKTYKVSTVSLQDLLSEHRAPNIIDYLSIDTEGSEYEILREFDFEKYSFKVITIEHNYTSSRGRIYKLLTTNGYIRVHKDISKFDDWYLNSRFITQRK